MLAFATSCVEEERFDNSPQGNFDALWHIIDERYCFLTYAQEQYGLDWDDVYTRYHKEAAEAQDNAQLFDVLGNMLRELRDGHVNLSSEYGMSYYWDWKLNYPINFSDSIQRNYLGKDFRINSGIYYTMLQDSVAYAYVGSFANSFGSSNITAVMIRLAHCKGLVLDIRNNGGGMLTAAEQFASHFITAKTHCGYIQHKTGTGHNDFSQPEPLHLEPAKGAHWLKPVVLLTNRGVYSSANHFTMLMRALPQVTVMGDKTGGGSGMPLSNSLPNGWSVRFSACPILDKEKRHTEFGIEPDTVVNMNSEDWNRGRDTMIDAACKHILQQYRER